MGEIHRVQKQRVRQLPIESRDGYEAIFNANCLVDIPEQLEVWDSKKVLLVVSKALDTNTNEIKKLEDRLGDLVVDKKIGVGSHTPYKDVVDIAHRLASKDVDCLISIGSSSYSDGCKIARIMNSVLKPGFTETDIESLMNQETGRANVDIKDDRVKLINVPTSLSAAEWNAVASATNLQGKKQHFGSFGGPSAANLILLDPEMASTAPRELWLSSGVRAIDHCVETMCSPQCNDEAREYVLRGLKALIAGLQKYSEGEGSNRDELLEGIDECQHGARDAMMGLLLWRIPMGPSHAIGHQLGSVGHVMHGVTSAIMLSPVLRFTKARNPAPQRTVVNAFNEVLGWHETEAADCLQKFVKKLGLPTRLSDVGVTSDEQVQTIAEKTMTDVWGGGKRQLEFDEILEILNMGIACVLNQVQTV